MGGFWNEKNEGCAALYGVAVGFVRMWRKFGEREYQFE
jgi:hypothetical protein